ncbi:hypothetical protein JI667_07265 [Bacillus sp. NTK074B]|uniref:hypothetical protein n=1 Tax=Bacillus sp. NTK074B TaxID=2802174 RepID=UPI001A8EDD4B|nr:hypothetical protein [Bacillus sp. NTK074B]
MMTQAQFVEELVGSLTKKDITFHDCLLEDKPETFHFGLKSIRKSLPERLLKTNRGLIRDLV